MLSKIRILIENTPRSVTMPDGMTRRRKVNIVSHLLPVSVWSIVSWATILLPAELIPLPEEANRSRPKQSPSVWFDFHIILVLC